VSTHLSARALVASMIVPLSALLACASGGAREPSLAAAQNASDTSSIANGDGKTVENLFAGRFPGVSVTPVVGGGFQIRIRGGNNTFYGSNEPLFLVDDLPLPQGSGGIVFLNPYDIQKIEVLKNPADIGLYGIRGANGVIKITTKRGGRP
jgi:TonB-dependent SusC/RagA subfamily outer membrane receptor